VVVFAGGKQAARGGERGRSAANVGQTLNIDHKSSKIKDSS
jgi:hypothetical protein